MLYNFLLPLTEYFTFFNILRYISIRTLGAMLFALVLTILVGPFFIRMLHKLKFGQQIHEDVVVHQKKPARRQWAAYSSFSAPCSRRFFSRI